MEIVSRGRPPAEIQRYGVCSHCGSVLKEKQENLKLKQNDLNSTGYYYDGPCPVCNHDGVWFDWARNPEQESF